MSKLIHLLEEIKRYGFLIINDYSKFTLVLFLHIKYCVFTKSEKLVKLLDNKLETRLVGIRSDGGGEYQRGFISYCEEIGITHEFSVSRTPQ